MRSSFRMNSHSSIQLRYSFMLVFSLRFIVMLGRMGVWDGGAGALGRRLVALELMVYVEVF